MCVSVIVYIYLCSIPEQIRNKRIIFIVGIKNNVKGNEQNIFFIMCPQCFHLVRFRVLYWVLFLQFIRFFRQNNTFF